MKRAVSFILLLAVFLADARPPADPYAGLDGTMELLDIPDTISPWWGTDLKPYFINHIGRHGARFLSSPKKFKAAEKFLLAAKADSNLSQRGRLTLAVLERIKENTGGRWGALTDAGVREEQLIAERLNALCPELFRQGRVSAIATYVPRVVHSMYAFTRRLESINTRLEIYTDEGPQYDPLLRFFEVNPLCAAYRQHGEWVDTMKVSRARYLPVRPAQRMLLDASGLTDEEARAVAADLYSIAQAMPAAALNYSPAIFFTPEEYRACADVADFERYLRNSASRLSDIPVEAARPLVKDILEAGEAAWRSHKESKPLVGRLRFGHAETLLPLFALLDMPDAFRPDLPLTVPAVALEWHDADLAPLAANLVYIYLADARGHRYVAALLNMRPVRPVPEGPYVLPLHAFQSRLRSLL